MKHWVWAPISSSFMVISIIGFFISIWLFDWSSELGLTWGFTFMLFFLMMFISAMISMTKSHATLEHMEHLAIHEHYNKKREHGEYHKMVKSLEAKKQTRFIGEDFVMGLFGLFLIYYSLASYIIGSPAINIPMVIFAILGITLFMTVLMIIDALSSEKINTLGKLFWIIILGVSIIVAPGVGPAIYYFYRRLRHQFGQ